MSYAGVSSDETFLKTIPIETAFWKDSDLFCTRPHLLIRLGADFETLIAERIETRNFNPVPLYDTLRTRRMIYPDKYFHAFCI
jgi:hypothetical protein